MSMSSNSNEGQMVNKSTSDDGSKASFSARWTMTILRTFHEPFLKHVLHPVTQRTARNPKRTVASVIVFSLLLLVGGLFTNFNVESDGDLLWTPQGVRTVEHRDWILRESGYPLLPRTFGFLVHADGANVLDSESAAIDGLFQALDTIRNMPDYEKACRGATYLSPFSGETTCEIEGPVKFWRNSRELFQVDQNNATADIIGTLSQTTFPDDTPVSDGDIYGFAQRQDNDPAGRIVSAKSMIMSIDFPETEDAEAFETDAIDAMLDLAEKWEKEGSSLRLEFLAERSIDDEIEAAILADIPLVPIVFTIMGIFTAVIFARRDPVQSRGFLGFTAVVSVLLSIMSGYGLMFLCGINFTSMTQLLPFVIFGIGLDDTFVIMGAYTHTDPKLDVLERIHVTMEEVGMSVTLTTVTSALAFGLGCLASVPAVYWLCLYAIPTIAFVYLYQITFFVAAIVLDEARVSQDRRDACLCCKKKLEAAGDDTDGTTTTKPSIIERFVEWYAEFLLRPVVKICVLIAFAALLGLCAWSASKLKQEFDVAEVMPDGSYAAAFLDSREAYADRSPIGPFAYFRYVDQSSTAVQDQMKAYVDELIASVDAIPNPPPFFWVDDFQAFIETEIETVGALPFNEQLDAFLAREEFSLLHGPDIVRDETTGDIAVSRVRLYMDNLVDVDVNYEIDTLKEQQDVSARQTVNEGNDYSFFMYDDLFQIWEFYAASVDELILTTILGVISVTAVALFLIPHYTAALFVLPLISVLYIDLLGVMQWGGVTIDPVAYVTCVMSIGLLVDFIIHVLLRYYECPGNRHEKTVTMLKSMGVSILTGGISTFLGTIPLAFSSSTIFSTIFIAFLGLSTLSVGHGLILLPVILSMIGPEDQIVRSSSTASVPTPTKGVTVDHQETVETA